MHPLNFNDKSDIRILMDSCAYEHFFTLLSDEGKQKLKRADLHLITPQMDHYIAFNYQLWNPEHFPEIADIQNALACLKEENYTVLEKSFKPQLENTQFDCCSGDYRRLESHIQLGFFDQLPEGTSCIPAVPANHSAVLGVETALQG